MARVVKASQPATILALATAVGKTRRAMLALLQSQPSSSLAGMANARTLAVGALTIGFRHDGMAPSLPPLLFYTWQPGQ